MMSWFSSTSAQCSCNYGIGSDGRIALIVDEKDRSWCTSSRDNDNRAVTIECASDKVYPYAVNDKVYASLIKLVADICQRNNIKKLVWSTDKNVRLNHTNGVNMTVHRDFANKECPGAYLYERHQDIMNKVNAILGASSTPIISLDEPKWYRVRLAWSNVSSQLGAFESLENAKLHCPVNYTVYDYNGKAVYTNQPTATSSATGSSGIPKSKEDYIEKVAKVAVELYPKTKIIPSVVIAQCCLETGYGLGTDSTELVKRNNLLGMKSDLINSTWKQYSVWDGTSFIKNTPEYYNGVKTYVNAQFRVYKDYKNCIEDYEMFLSYVQNGAGYKYRKIIGMTDPKSVITAISQGGYATDPNYITSVMRVINENNLTKYDKQAGVNGSVETSVKPSTTPTVDKYYRVAKSYTNGKYEGQLGAYTVQDNAIKNCKSGYYVFDPNGNIVYPSKVIGYRVQIGTYSKIENANACAKKLKDKGFKITLVADGTNTKVMHEKTFKKLENA